MKSLKIKPEYQGLIITRNHMILGQITFDPFKVDPEHYINFYNNGFDYIFYEVETKPKKQLLKEGK